MRPLREQVEDARNRYLRDIASEQSKDNRYTLTTVEAAFLSGMSLVADFLIKEPLLAVELKEVIVTIGEEQGMVVGHLPPDQYKETR